MSKSVRLTVYVFFVAFAALLAKDHYVDPLHGQNNNDGSKESPWKTLANVLSSKKKIIQAGDRIFLRRGYHGFLTITGHNESDVYILPEKGHTPTIKSITFGESSHWNIRGLMISPALVPEGHPDHNQGGQGAKFLKGSVHNTLEDCYFYKTQDASNWKDYQWRYGLRAGINIDGGARNTIRGNHMYLAGKMGVNFQSPANYFGYNTVEHFSSDGFGIKGNSTVAEYNTIMNSHKVSSNHNDLCQAYGSGSLFRFNELRAFSNPNDPFTDFGVQGLGMFDGVKKNWIIEGNLIRTNFVIGIWAIADVTNFIIKDNIVSRITVNKNTRNGPTIAVKKADKKKWPNKSGKTPKHTTVTGNSAWGYEFQIQNAGSDHKIGNNTTNRNVWQPPHDVTPPTTPRNLTSVHIPGYGFDLHWDCSTDNIKVIGYEIYYNGVRVGRTRVGNNFFARNNGSEGVYTVKAYDYNQNFSEASLPANTDSYTSNDTTPPSRPTNLKSTQIRSHGVDLHWDASRDNHKVKAYEVYRNGIKIGRSRNGATFFDPNQSINNIYKVRAYDYNGNFSEFSLPSGSPPEPTPDPVPAPTPEPTPTPVPEPTPEPTPSPLPPPPPPPPAPEPAPEPTPTPVPEPTPTPVPEPTPLPVPEPMPDPESDEGLLVYEPFDGTGRLHDSSGGTGWSTPWVVRKGFENHYRLTKTSALFKASGGLRGQTGYAIRSFEESIVDDGRTYWVSFRIQAKNYHKSASLTLKGLDKDLFKLRVGHGLAFDFLGQPVMGKGDNQTHHIFIRMNMSGDGNAETASIYLDPDLNTNPGNWKALATRPFNIAANGLTGLESISARTGKGYVFMLDEFRISTLHGDTPSKPEPTPTPTPEPVPTPAPEPDPAPEPVPVPVPPEEAKLLLYEGFDYPKNRFLNGLNGGSGWSSGWNVFHYFNKTYSLSGKGLSYPGVKSTGKSASFSAAGINSRSGYIHRKFAAPILDDGKTIWLSFLMAVPSYQKGATISLMGSKSNLFDLTQGIGCHLNFLGQKVLSDTSRKTHLLLVKINMSGDEQKETATLYINPDLSQDAGTWKGIERPMEIDAEGLQAFYSKGARVGKNYRFFIDEIRIATDLQQVIQ